MHMHIKYIIIFIYSICEYSQIVLDLFPEFLHHLSSLSLAVHKVRVSISHRVLGSIQLSNCQLKGLMQYLIDIFFTFFWLPIILNAFWNSYEYIGFFFCTLFVCFLCPLSVIPLQLTEGIPWWYCLDTDTLVKDTMCIIFFPITINSLAKFLNF